MDTSLIRKPSAWVPVGMAAMALALVLGYAATHGTARQADEGTAAHLWQILMAAEVPAIGFFAFKWLPSRPVGAAFVLSVQAASVLAAAFPVWWWQW